MLNKLQATPRISVALATFNGVAHLKEQLDSIQQQTLPPSELVVSDDGSTDGTLDIVSDFASRSGFPVHVARNRERLGFRANFLRAAERCSGDLIAFCDQDDVWERDKLESLREPFDDTEVLLVHHDAIVMDAAGTSLGTLHRWRKPSPMMPANTEDPWRISHGFTQMFRSELCAFNPLWLKSLDPDRPASRMAHDQWMFFLATSLGRTAYVNRPLARYRQHITNAAGWTPTVGLLRRAVMRLENRTDVYARCLQAADRRCEILATIKQSAVSASMRSNAETAEQRYALLRSLYEHRHRLYASSSLRSRIRGYHHLLRTGAYSRQGPFTFTYKGAVKDAALGVAFGNLTRRFGLPPSGGDPTCRATG